MCCIDACYLQFLICHGGFLLFDPLDLSTDLQMGVDGALKCELDYRADRSLWTAKLSEVENMPSQAPGRPKAVLMTHWHPINPIHAHAHTLTQTKALEHKQKFHCYANGGQAAAFYEDLKELVILSLTWHLGAQNDTLRITQALQFTALWSFYYMSISLLFSCNILASTMSNYRCISLN